MKIKEWCKCENPIVCAFGSLTCLHCGNIILDNVYKIDKKFRHMRDIDKWKGELLNAK